MSVVVPVRDAARTIRDTIRSLLSQRFESFEVIAVVSADDPSLALLREFQGDSRLKIRIAPGRCGVPQLRRDGLLAAAAPWIAITEDHCILPPHWLREASSRMAAGDWAACGGPVANGRRSWVGWAQYFTRYASFLPPVREAASLSLPGNSACYRRESLLAQAGLLADGFWEAEINQALSGGGSRLWMTPALAVEQRQHRSLLEFLALRFRHGRCYGARRMARLSASSRTGLFLRSPIIPLVLFGRVLRSLIAKPHYWIPFLPAAPLVLVYQVSWAIGEALGYLTGAGRSCLQTD
jgi:glycosyltransferase involved in cell wall biosynthesis